ncbi:CsbD family protein [Roseobacter litoralis]|uniref:CsbD family protein n=1 Tax=Roseobacter litoralis TaxID=42443 RepID=UPI0031EB2CC7
MNWDQIQGSWKKMTGNVKAKWGELTDAEIAEFDGNREALEGKVQAKYGKTKKEAKKEGDDFVTANRSFVCYPIRASGDWDGHQDYGFNQGIEMKNTDKPHD